MSDMFNEWGLTGFGDLFADIYDGMNTIYDVFIEQHYEVNIPELNIDWSFNLMSVLFGVGITTFIGVVIVNFFRGK